MHPLPACASGEWGPMKAQRHFNIIPEHKYKNAIIEAHDQLLELKFELPKTLKIHGKLHNNTLSDLDKLVKHDVQLSHSGNGQQLTISVQLPEEGQYGLDIYARDPEYQTEKRTMSHCCKYLINFNKKNVTATSMPQFQSLSSNQSIQSVSPGSTSIKKPITDSNQQQQIFIGPNTEILAELGMIPTSHLEPIIKLQEDHQVIDLQFKMSKAVDFSFDLKYSSTTSLSNSSYSQLRASENVKVKQYGYTISFTLSLPHQKYGQYLFTVYASDDTNKTKHLPAVYTYLIKYYLLSTNR
jgi:hypothetical protein